MGKAAAKSTKTTTPAQDEIERSLAILSARQQFVGAAVSMGWQLALTVIVPVVIGVKLDDHFKSTPSYTLAALIIAIGAATTVVLNTLKQVANEQAKEDKK